MQQLISNKAGVETADQLNVKTADNQIFLTLSSSVTGIPFWEALQSILRPFSPNHSAVCNSIPTDQSSSITDWS